MGAVLFVFLPLPPVFTFCFIMKSTKVNIGVLLFLASIFPSVRLKTVFTRNPQVCQDVEIVPREEWMARPRWREWRMKTPVNDVIIIHTVTPECHTKQQCLRSVNFIQEYHKDYLGAGDIPYNFLVGGDGRIYEGRGWTTAGAHSVNFNTISIGVAFIGNYMKVVPNQSMLDAALNLIACGVQKGYLSPTREIHGHRDVSCTLSPGDELYAIIRTWKNYKGGRLPHYYC